jgi:heat shock protein HslJ
VLALACLAGCAPAAAGGSGGTTESAPPAISAVVSSTPQAGDGGVPDRPDAVMPFPDAPAPPAGHGTPVRSPFQIQGRWRLSYAGGAGLPPTELPQIEITADRISGSTGCNRMGGVLVWRSDGAVFVGDVVTTKMACMGLRGDLERAVLAALSATRRMEQSGGVLHLLDEEGKILASYARVGPPAPAQPAVPVTTGIEGTQWLLAMLNNQPVVTDKPPTLRLRNGEAGGSTGCNSWGSPYALSGDSLSIRSPVQTEMACASPAVMALEREFGETLVLITRAQVEGERLILTAPEGRARMEFVPAPG